METGQKRAREQQVVCQMIALYCRARHAQPKGRLCPECRALAEYVCRRVDGCPHMETKTFCSNCKTHCYKPEMRRNIRAVMRRAGPRILLAHPVFAVRHVMGSQREKRSL